MYGSRRTTKTLVNGSTQQVTAALSTKTLTDAPVRHGHPVALEAVPTDSIGRRTQKSISKYWEVKYHIRYRIILRATPDGSGQRSWNRPRSSSTSDRRTSGHRPPVVAILDDQGSGRALTETFSPPVSRVHSQTPVHRSIRIAPGPVCDSRSPLVRTSKTRTGTCSRFVSDRPPGELQGGLANLPNSSHPVLRPSYHFKWYSIYSIIQRRYTPEDAPAQSIESTFIPLP